MATYQQLQDDVLWYLDRQDAAARIPSWVAMVETELQQTLRARCMEVSAIQAVDTAYITLPPDFSTMASISDAATGKLLVLKDEWSGSWTDVSGPSGTIVSGTYDGTRRRGPTGSWQTASSSCRTRGYPDPPDPLLGAADRPDELVCQAQGAAAAVRHQPGAGAALFGLSLRCAGHATLAEQEESMAPAWDAKYQQAVTRANLNKQQSDMQGAPYTEEMSGVF